MIDYYLPRAAQTPVTLEIRDPAGALVRRFSSAAPAPEAEAEPYFAAAWLKAPAPLSAAAGAHRFVWDLRHPRPRALEYEWSIAASPFEGASLSPAGPLALPGRYRLTLAVNGRRLEAPLEVLPDPRVATPAAELAAALEFSRSLAADLGEVWRGALAAQLAALDAALEPIAAGAGEATMSLALAGQVLAAIQADVEGADRAPTAPQREAVDRIHDAVRTALAGWRAVHRGELKAANRALVAARLAPLLVPDAKELHAAEPPAGQELP